MHQCLMMFCAQGGVDDVFTYEVLKKKYYSSENTLIAQVYLINWII